MLRPLIALILCAGLAGAMDADAFNAAFAGEDHAAKKAAIAALPGGLPDNDAMRLLIARLSDRQGGALALEKLRAIAKTGTADEDPKDWGAWLAAKVAKEKEKAEQEKRIKDLEAKTAPKTEAPKSASAAAVAPPAAPVVIPEDLGKPARIMLKGGGSVVCYIRSKRTDADGKLISVRIVHLDGVGEETLTAALIADIQEDLR